MDTEWAERVHRVMMGTVDQIQRGETEHAFGDIDRTLADALHDNQELWIKTLCKHAAVMAHAAGDLDREIRYTKQALPSLPRTANSPSITLLNYCCAMGRLVPLNSTPLRLIS
jgi:hypothetical protein